MTGRRVLIVAAHPDDDVIGCGGFIARTAASGGTVRVAYVSDGSASHPKSRRFPPSRVAAMRASEAREALAILGVSTPPVFLNYPDGEIAKLDARARGHAVDAVAREIDAFEADLVLAPWRRDPHPDHVATHAIAKDAVAQMTAKIAFHEYEVWLAIRADDGDLPQPGEVRTLALALTTREIACKRSAILAHHTQTTALIDDDPDGFRIDEALLTTWLRPFERYHGSSPSQTLHGVG